ncbi:DNA glycosylase [Mytilinidion resinicola]|uniref:DNA-(apurinic or apyrimidinic site) lyase n=1 Tax=Mytilinidion resinicola TaxID=574789 RepID=A0A6A6YC82_9PEZI|nr:DNA glycosylase [Mytilinidion resinicola]KAF2806123.1 DNA glycosylase [Mytilinidion resinicola]
MPSLRASEWQNLPVSLKELCINTTLRCGQSFRWRKSAEDEWSLALHGRILSLRQDSERLHYRASFPSAALAPPTPPASTVPSAAESVNQDDDDTLALVKHYFNLTPNLAQLYDQWALADPNFRKRAPKFTGVRILQQDAWEALIGFICSSNNNISRISQMVHNLCLHYGPLIGHVGATPYHDFPTPKALTGPKVEQHLQKLGFGYRAKYIYKTAVMVEEKGLDWLQDLCNPENPPLGVDPKPAGELVEGGRGGYRRAHEELLALHGVGPKVADCVCLMGLGWSESVPVDTHVWQIAQRDYKFGKGKHSSLTKATYDAVANRFRSLWGKEAGWAHSVLFTADLKTFSERLVAKVEVKEETVVKIEVDGIKQEADMVRMETITEKRVKRPFVKEEHQVLEVKEEKVTRKRAKRTKT